MGDRQRRIGQHATREAPLWATQALGPVPEDPQRRAGWESRAGKLGACRQMLRYDHPGEAIGPEPAATFPEARAEWHATFAVMARVEGIDVRHLTDGQLLARRRAYEGRDPLDPGARRGRASSRSATRDPYAEAAASNYQ